MDKKEELKSEKKQVEMVTGTINLCIPISDLDAIRKHPHGKIAKDYKKSYIEMLMSIDGTLKEKKSETK